MYTVNFHTGIGNYTSNKELNDLITEVSEDLAYTQQPVTIEEDGNVVARLPWYGYGFEEDDIVTAHFGDLGFYGEWIVGE